MTNTNKDTKKTVSIVTITQIGRYNTLCLLADNILSQTYPNILEWVIVEASNTLDESITNADNIHRYIGQKMDPMEVVILPFEEGARLGRHRNRGNDACRGDIIVCMDDDDHYFKDRIEVSVHALSRKNDVLICGSTDMLIYDLIVQKLYQFRGFGDSHSTNNCMAYKKEYLENHRYNDDKKAGEEEEFTNKFTEPMAQIDPYSCVLQFSHSYNTYNKRDLIVKATIGINPVLFPINDVVIKKLIPEHLLQKYENYLLKRVNVLSTYDTIYFTGGLCPPWSPYEKDLGGSEQAIVHLSSEWVKKGKRVAVYTVLKPETELKISKDGVDYICWKDFPYNSVLPKVILWRLSGMYYFFPFKTEFYSLTIDLHDFVNENEIKLFYDCKNIIKKIVFKSQFHIDQFNMLCNKYGYTFNENQIVNIPNGVREDMMKYEPDIYGPRQKYRFCYTSRYDRGLAQLLLYTWPILYRHEPRCELHVYYGMDYLDENSDVKKNLKSLLSLPGIMDHGRQPLDIIKREKHLSNFHLYFTSTRSEIDCIAIKESIALGCIPILSDSHVFKERDGIHFHLEDDNHIPSYENLAIEILKLLRLDNEEIEKHRQEVMRSKTIVSWENISQQWLDL